MTEPDFILLDELVERLGMSKTVLAQHFAAAIDKYELKNTEMPTQLELAHAALLASIEAEQVKTHLH